MGRIAFTALAFLVSASQADAQDGLPALRARGALRWGADAEGGAPYVFKDPRDPNRLVGFEWDLAALLARELGVRAEMVQNQWDKLLDAVNRGDFDVAMNGIEVTEDRREVVAFTRPYYVAPEQLVVRKTDSHVTGLADLAGKRVGTLKASLAARILRGVGLFKEGDIAEYEGQVEPYQDLKLGRLDGVLMDYPIAQYCARPERDLAFAGPPFGQAFYAIAVRKGDAALLSALNEALDRLARTGELRALYERWALWNDATADLLGDRAPSTAPAPEYESYLEAIGKKPGLGERLARYATFLPPLLAGALVTLLLSVSAMALAVALGIGLAVARLYGPRALRALAAAYVELVRGTPLLVQLYMIYYGLPQAGVVLSAPVAAFLGLGLNYAAYEAENYRAGIQAVPRGQTEAALSLGMGRLQALRHVVLPQAFRIVIPPVTNDFISLLKDSSIVAVIAMVELTKQYGMLAAAHQDYLGVGALAAALYFGLGLPFARLARWSEVRFATDRAAWPAAA
ncbi:MAG: ABC transporter substrate-binding protein/permease [Planctomycetales bacterium]|nr:ABC transporter substrate-binding protein/permease [Planctomycetales bacterium]